MPNQVETIELTVDDRPAVQGADRANARLEQFEKTGARAAQSTSKAFEDVGATVVRFADRSASGMERSLASLQRRLAQFSSPAERLASERVAALPRFAGDEERLRRATELYDQLAAAQKRADNTALLERAQRASRAAEGATSAFQVALSRSNAERQREAKLAEQESRAIEGQVRQIERSRALSDAGAVDRLRLQRKFALEDLGPKASPEQVARVQRAFQSAIEAEEKLGEAAGLKGFGDRLRGFVEDPLGSARNLLQSVFGGITAGGLAAAAGLAVLATAAEKAFGIVADAGKKAETSLNLAERLGTTVAEAQTLSAVARITSVDIGSVESSVKKLSSALAEGGNEGKQGADALKSIGVFARDSQGKLKGFYQLFGQIADGIDKLPDH